MSQEKQSTGSKVVDINRVIQTGRLASDPERKETTTGKTMATFRFANNSSRKSDTNFFTVTCFDTTAENVLKYLKSGKRVAIDGKLRFREWKDDDGETRSAVDITAHDVLFLSPPTGETAASEEPGADETPVALEDAASSEAAPSEKEAEPVF